MGCPAKQFVTSQAECLKSLLKLEATRNVSVEKLVESIQELVQQQQRNMEGATEVAHFNVIFSNPRRLLVFHIARRSLKTCQDLKIVIYQTTTILPVKERNLETTKIIDGLSMFAHAALVLKEKVDDHFSVSLPDFKQLSQILSQLTANVI